jgi:hypothetical protein
MSEIFGRASSGRTAVAKRCRTLLFGVAMALLAPALLSLSACGGGGDDVIRSIGLTREPPDEFTVTTRAPLSMPPDFTLRPPEPGAARPNERTPRQAAEATLVPSTALAATPGVTPGQQALIAAAGKPASPTIRSDLNREAGQEASSKSLTDRLMFWKDNPVPGVVVDPQAEAKRLRENAALGQPTDAGDTPIIQRTRKGFLDGIF